MEAQGTPYIKETGGKEMGTILEKLSKEKQLVVLCSKGYLTEDEEKKVRVLLEEELDWSDILFQAVFHRVLNMMYYHFKCLGVLKQLNEEVLKIMKTQVAIYQLRNQQYFKELSEIYEDFAKEDLRTVILKGNYLAAKVYPECYMRTFNDLDILIDIKDGDKLVSILEERGYIQGDYDKQEEKVIPATRRQKMMHQMSTHELEACWKQTDDTVVPVFEVDLNHSIMWKGNCPYEINTRMLLDRAKQDSLEDKTVYTLNCEDFLFQLACHLYKEAVVINWIADLRDLKLYKFADIATYVWKYGEEINWKELLKFSEVNQTHKILYYVFYYVNYLYGDFIPQWVMEAVEQRDKKMLNQYGVENDKPFTWKSEFHERLFNDKHIREVEEKAMNKFKEFWDNRTSLQG